MTGWEIVGAIGVGLMVVMFLAWIGYDDPTALAALFFSAVVTCVFAGLLGLALGAWSP